MKLKGKAIIFSAPSGSGKTTIAQHLLNKNDKLGFSISACTRPPRNKSEEQGKDYHFFTPAEFKKKIDDNEFVEWEEVYIGAFYGTLKSEIQKLWENGKTIVFDVDVKGGVNLKKYFGKNALAIFVRIPSIEILEQRLRERNTETEENIAKRVFKANFELSFQEQFDVVIVNDKLENALLEAESIVNEFLAKPIN